MILSTNTWIKGGGNGSMSESIVALLCLGFIGGTIVATVILGLVISGDKEQFDGDRGVDVCVPCGDRDRSSNNRHDKQVVTEEKGEKE